MALILILLLLILLLGGVGFSIHLLWIIAAVVFVVWLFGFAANSSGGRWYSW
jgi:hypothetical protein